MEFLIHNLAPIMFVGLMLFLLLGFPVAFSLGACGLFFAFVGIELGVLPEALLQALPLRVFGIMQNETMLAIPFFTLMGLILERSGMAEDLLETVGQLFGPIRGGVAFAVIFVGALLAATTGVVAASVISMGLISLPIMLRYGYDRRIASGVIAASGTLAQIIPPSLVLIVLADQLGRSVGDMYKGALLPGMMLTGSYALFIIALAIFKPSLVPALPPEARTLREADGRSGLPSTLVMLVLCTTASVIVGHYMPQIHTWWTGELVESVALDETIVVAMCFGVALAFVIAMFNKLTGLHLLSKMAERVTFVLIPPLLLIFLVLGTIFLGVATPTEGGAMGALGAAIMALARGRLNMDLLKQALMTTTKLSCFVMFILIGATMFGLTFQGVDGPKWVEELLVSLPGGELGFLIVVNIMIFLLAFFLDFFELSFIVVPLLAPVAEKLGIDLVWFGVLLAVNMQTSFMHPPFGFALFFLRSVAPEKPYTDKVTKKTVAPVTTMQIYAGAIPFVVLQLIMVALIIAYPGIVSSNLDKKVEYDLDKVRLEMEAAMPDAVDFDDPMFGNDGAPEAEMPEAPSSDDDALKALEQQIEHEQSAAEPAK
ncbi:TRAP transporter large permease [Comamonas composti]|uniref:TRAP transporter large permease n=1 Tax=Comamonas composti TaxID=408558 RepID=UPI000400027A|nr:TRAP transporter large permease subunit [Comamonas composti]